MYACTVEGRCVQNRASAPSPATCSGGVHGLV